MVSEDPQRFLGDKYSIDDFEQVKDVVKFGLTVVLHTHFV